MKIDKKDLFILSSLINNFRQSDRQIGMQLDISGGAVRARINKMTKEKVIDDYYLKVEPAVFGYDAIYIVTSGQEIKEITKQLNLIGEPFLIVPCIGGITVCGIVVREDIERKIELAKSIMRDVRTLSIFHARNFPIKSNLTTTDLAIIETLMKNPRANIETIASKTNLSTKTIARELEKFQEENIAQFTISYDPQKIDGHIPYVLLISVKEKLESILDQLQQKFSENLMQEPILSVNQIVLFMHSDDIFKLDNIIEKIREIENIQSIDMFVPKLVLFPREWMSNILKNAKNSPTLHLTYDV